MSILIKNMEMPKNCAQCLLKASCIHRIYMAERPSDCPLVELPPHGRLIDADALNKAIRTDIMGGLNYEYFIEVAPTIIEAEGE